MHSGDIWGDRRCRLGHAELASLICAAEGITYEHALTARKLPSGRVELVDGLHRWAVATELGFDLVPVEMKSPTESVGAWPAPGDCYGSVTNR